MYAARDGAQVEPPFDPVSFRSRRRITGFADSDANKLLLAEQAARVRSAAMEIIDAANAIKDFVGLDAANLSIARKVKEYREAARRVLGSSFNALPDATLPNGDELAKAAAFRDGGDLTRHHANPFLVEEWLQGCARVREKLDEWERVRGLVEILHDTTLAIEPIHLPFRDTDHWVAFEYPETFVPEGQFLSDANGRLSG